MSRQKHSIYQISTLSSSGLRQQRRGTSTSKKKSITEISTPNVTDQNRDSRGSYDIARRLSWIEKVRRRSVLTTKGKVVLEARFNVDFHGLYSARFSYDGERLITAYGVGAIQLWHVISNEHCVNIRTAAHHGFPIMCIRLHPTEKDHFFAGGSCGNIFLCGMAAGEYKNFAKETNEINSVDVSLSGSTLVSGGKDAVLRIYDVGTGKIKDKIFRNDENTTDDQVMRYHRMRIFAVKFHPCAENIFLSGGWDDCVKMWDMRVKGAHIGDIRGPHICGDAVDVRDNVVLTASWTVENSLQLWDLSSGGLIDNINPVNRQRGVDGEFLYCCQFFAGDSGGTTVVTGGSGVGRVEVIDLTEKRVIASFRVHKSVQAIDTIDDYLAFGGMESMFRVAML